MTLNTQTHLGDHHFTGPFASNEQIPSQSGVYLITTLAPNQRHTIIDVGESQNVHDRIRNHDRTPQWQRNQQHGLFAWVLSANELQRMVIEKAHRLAYAPVCGDR
jgi:excinuclease UvrABC nuclease subunit